MPRETIGTRGNHTEIAWVKGKYAQVGVVSMEPLPADLKNLEDGYGLWADLDVEGIDRLQKILRRVKRQLEMEPDPVE